MKFYYLLVIGVLSILNSYAQLSKIYITSKGEYSADPKQAVSYNLIEKIDDSTYHVRNYDMKDTVIYQGVYKDELLTKPNGRFIYYTKKTIPDNLKGVLRTNTNNFISKVGYFSNGMKTRMWTEFERQGIKRCTYIYKGDKLNGLYRRFDGHHNSYVIEEGNYVEDKKEGTWNFFGLDTLYVPMTTMEFSNNKLIKEIVRYKSLSYPDWFAEILFKKLSFKWDITQPNIKILITVNTDGSVINSKITRSNSPKVDGIVMDFFNKSKLIPSSYDGKPIMKTYELEVGIFGSPTRLNRIEISNPIIRKEDEFIKNGD